MGNNISDTNKTPKKMLIFGIDDDPQANELFVFPIKLFGNNIKAPKKLLIWVDDNPQNNRVLVSRIKKKDESIEIIKFKSTKEFVDFAKKFHKFKSGKIECRIITDMHRLEDDVSVDDAGFQLIEKIRNDFDSKCPILIFTSGSRIVKIQDKLREFKWNGVRTTFSGGECTSFGLFKNDEGEQDVKESEENYKSFSMHGVEQDEKEFLSKEKDFYQEDQEEEEKLLAVKKVTPKDRAEMVITSEKSLPFVEKKFKLQNISVKKLGKEMEKFGLAHEFKKWCEHVDKVLELKGHVYKNIKKECLIAFHGFTTNEFQEKLIEFSKDQYLFFTLPIFCNCLNYAMLTMEICNTMEFKTLYHVTDNIKTIMALEKALGTGFGIASVRPVIVSSIRPKQVPKGKVVLKFHFPCDDEDSKNLPYILVGNFSKFENRYSEVILPQFQQWSVDGRKDGVYMLKLKKKLNV